MEVTLQYFKLSNIDFVWSKIAISRRDLETYLPVRELQKNEIKLANWSIGTCMVVSCMTFDTETSKPVLIDALLPQRRTGSFWLY